MNTAIEVEKIAKKFCRSLKRSMRYGVADVARDLVGIPSGGGRLRKDEFWAFRDVSFQVRPGECLGVIGANGAGKSTILKLLAGIYPPDLGSVSVHGRVGSLIEVGAGFHPLLSGRENVYINGAILGMCKKEIAARFDEIVAFSGVEDFIDSPVKHYSSGMFVRLGFAVAAHSSPDVLLVDEALAVGDMAFSVKCLNRIAELRSRGTAVLFVSHNELLVRQAATTCLLLDAGRATEFADMGEAFFAYNKITGAAVCRSDEGSADSSSSGVIVHSLSPVGSSGGKEVCTGDNLRFLVECSANKRYEDTDMELRIWGQDGQLISVLKSSNQSRLIDLPEGESVIAVDIDAVPLQPGRYRIAGGFNRQGEILFWSRNITEIDILPPERLNTEAGLVRLRASFGTPESAPIREHRMFV